MTTTNHTETFGKQTYAEFRAGLTRLAKKQRDETGELCSWYTSDAGNAIFFTTLKDAHGFWATHREDFTGKKIRTVYKYL